MVWFLYKSSSYISTGNKSDQSEVGGNKVILAWIWQEWTFSRKNCIWKLSLELCQKLKVSLCTCSNLVQGYHTHVVYTYLTSIGMVTWPRKEKDNISTWWNCSRRHQTPVNRRTNLRTRSNFLFYRRLLVHGYLLQYYHVGLNVQGYT